MSEYIPIANLRAKRIFDLVLLTPILLCCLPIFFFIILGYRITGLIWEEDRGPVFHKVLRSSWGTTVLVYKVRVSTVSYLNRESAKLTHDRLEWLGTYLDEANKAILIKNPEYVVEDDGGDPTKWGKILKSFYLDELPQLFNILLGQMSFVGPRPLPFKDLRIRPDVDGLVEVAGERIEYSFRDKLPGGLTGYYQLNKNERARTNYERFMLEGVELDRKYLNYLLKKGPFEVVLKDLLILVSTIKVIVFHRGI